MDNGRSNPKWAQSPSLLPCPQHSKELNLGTGQEQLPCQENRLILTSKATVPQKLYLYDIIITLQTHLWEEGPIFPLRL